MTRRCLVENYFSAEERGDVEAVVALCADDVIVRNAAQPPQHGHDGVRAYVGSFRERTAVRQFDVIAIAEESDVVFASWRARLTFRAGVAFGPIVAKRPFDVDLHGVCRFKLDKSNRIQQLDVYHETTTPMERARENA